MCNFNENIYHYTNCNVPNEHYLHISFQGEPAERCQEDPHDRYVPIPGQCDKCFPVENPQQPPTATGTGESVLIEHTDMDFPTFSEGYHAAGYEEYIERADQEDNFCKFHIAWNLPAAIEGEQDMETFLLEAVTLTRTESSVKAISCQEYVREGYGPMGLVLLKNLFSALKSPDNCYEDSTMDIYASHGLLDVSLDVELSRLRSMLLWLCLSFVKPLYGTVCISTAAITHDSIMLLPLEPIEDTDSLFGQTGWCGMFDTAIIAQDPRLQPCECAWLEVDFNLMVALSGVQWSVVHDGGLLLRGSLTALTPLGEGDDAIVWYFETKEHIEPSDSDELIAVQTPWMRTLDMRRLRSKKALVSWCCPAELYWDTPHSQVICETWVPEAQRRLDEYTDALAYYQQFEDCLTSDEGMVIPERDQSFVPVS